MSQAKDTENYISFTRQDGRKYEIQMLPTEWTRTKHPHYYLMRWDAEANTWMLAARFNSEAEARQFIAFFR